MAVKLLKGNEAVVYGALLGGATHFFGYPITPASEIAHTAAQLFPRLGRVFLQAESETAAINMLYGAASAGARTMTASSGPGISLMNEGLSYIAGAELPCLVVDIQRAGPGLGNIWPEQSDYNMTVKGGGHGNYHNIVYAPASGQEMYEFAYRAFLPAEKYRACVVLLSDAYIGQMMEPVRFEEEPLSAGRNGWAVYGDAGSRGNLITSIFMSAVLQGAHNENLQEKYRLMATELPEWEELYTEDADTIIAAFGITSRICRSAVLTLRQKGYKTGLYRPKTLFPFPSARLSSLMDTAENIITAELNNGHMAQDVENISSGRNRTLRYNWYGGLVPSEAEIEKRIMRDIYA
ncbi:MAG: 3-methyl-2-oxobutanoate dehydrogenase subunit VorB [Spirochaetales bacterium]|nr:MAG: 3-methyl-2-oxobutanoate dehydrogenase subunit VorB [Spirochaetales bacterium]